MCFYITGLGSANLGQDILVKLKVAYTLVEQLYSGTQCTIAAITHTKEPPSLLKDVLNQLSVLPQRVTKIKRSSARAGAITALSRAKAWQPELDPTELASGYPSYKEDGTPFTAEDFAVCVREVSPIATKLAEETTFRDIRRLIQQRTQEKRLWFMKLST